MGMGTPLGNYQAWGSCPVSYHRTQGYYPQTGRTPTLDVRLSISTTTLITFEEGDINTWVWALPLATAKLGEVVPVWYPHHTPIFTFF